MRVGPARPCRPGWTEAARLEPDGDRKGETLTKSGDWTTSEFKQKLNHRAMRVLRCCA